MFGIFPRRLFWVPIGAVLVGVCIMWLYLSAR